MEIKRFSEDELNGLSKEMIISLYLQLDTSFQLLSDQNKQILKQMDNLQEQMAILINHRFGRKTEKTSEVIEGQMVLDINGQPLILNEVEWECEHAKEPEKTDEDLLREAMERAKKRKRKKGVRELDLRSARVEVEEYTLSDEELQELFPEGYRELGVKVSYRVEYTPAELVVHEERIHKYKAEKENTFVCAEHPRHLFAHSYTTPSLLSKIWMDKYVNGLPINRISREIWWSDLTIRPPTICRWMEQLTERYLQPVDQMMRMEILKARLIHCDETPFVCEEDRKKEGRTKNSKSYMWVYHTADQYGSPPIFIYDYKDNRRTENVERFLKGYRGIIMADGYEPYHTVARMSNGDIVVAGCWAHLKRKFMEVVKVDPKNAKGTIAYEGNERIGKIYHLDNKMKHALEAERLAYRQKVVKPLVDDFFEWAKEYTEKVASERTQAALTYAINQEKYLREFLASGIIPLDNSDAERSIRSFCVGKHSWHITASSRGAATSGILYSIAETTKANGLKPYEYFKFLLENLLRYEDELTDERLRSIMPWSDRLPSELKSKDDKRNTH